MVFVRAMIFPISSCFSRFPISSTSWSILSSETNRPAFCLNLRSRSLNSKGSAGSPFGVFLYPSKVIPSFMMTDTRAPSFKGLTVSAFTFFINASSWGSRIFASVNFSSVTSPSDKASAARNHKLNLPSAPIFGSRIPADVNATGPVSMLMASTWLILTWCLALISARRSIVECVQAQVG